MLISDVEFAEIYARWFKTVYRVCFAYMKNPHDCEDAAADTFVKLMKRASAFESCEHEKAWLIRAAVNVCKDNLKSWWRKRADLSEAYEIADSFEIDETLSVVLDLPEKYKTVILLYYYEGYSGDEIAEILKKPPSTVRNHLHEARKVLKEILGEDYG
jgi:RNA polymerase sigma-70 factor (ECF subfamily)